MTLHTQDRPKHSTQVTERSSRPIGTTIPAVFITSKMKIHLLPKGFPAIKRLQYFYTNDRSHSRKAHGPEGTQVLRVPHCHTQVTQHISALLPWGPRREAERNPPGTFLLQTQQPQEIFASVALGKKGVKNIQE